MLVMAANFFFSTYSFDLVDVQGEIVEVLAGNVTAANGTVTLTMPSSTIAGVIVRADK